MVTERPLLHIVERGHGPSGYINLKKNLLALVEEAGWDFLFFGSTRIAMHKLKESPPNALAANILNNEQAPQKGPLVQVLARAHAMGIPVAVITHHPQDEVQHLLVSENDQYLQPSPHLEIEPLRRPFICWLGNIAENLYA